MKVFLFLLLCCYVLWQTLQKWPDSYLHVAVCDVGQGDAILISYAWWQLLVDTGPDEAVLSCLEKQMPSLDKRIELLILTHFDQDHIGGTAALLKLYDFAYIFLPLTDGKDSKTFLELQQLLLAEQSYGAQLKEPFLGQQIALAIEQPTFQAKNDHFQAKYNSSQTLLLTFLTPGQLSAAEFNYLRKKALFLGQRPETTLSAADWVELAVNDSENDRSIVLLLQFGRLKILLTGDLEKTGEAALLGSGLITEVDILKVGHHGAKTSTSTEFLAWLRPETALISTGEKNQFGHPTQEVLRLLEQFSSQILRTDQLGDIEIVSDGDNFWLAAEKPKLF